MFGNVRLVVGTILENLRKSSENHQKHRHQHVYIIKRTLPIFPYTVEGNTYMLFTGREVRMGKNCARGLEYGPEAEGRGLSSRPSAQFFPIRTDLAR